MVGLVKKYDYINLKRKPINGSRHYETVSGNVPSVTTILGTSKNKDGIKKWIQKVGEEEANRIKVEASPITRNSEGKCLLEGKQTEKAKQLPSR